MMRYRSFVMVVRLINVVLIELCVRNVLKLVVILIVLMMLLMMSKRM